MKQAKRIRRKLSKVIKMVIHTRIKDSIRLIIPLILLIFLPTVSFSDTEMFSQESGMYKEATESYRQAIRINPDGADTHRGIGDAFIGAGMHKESIEPYRQTIRINLDDTNAHYNLGITYGKSGMHKEAIEAFQKVIWINPDDADAHSVLEQYKTLKSLDPGLADELFNSIYE